MIQLRETNPDGAIREITFSDKSEACKTLRLMFGAETPENVRRAEERQALNDSLREQFRRGKSSNSIGEALKNAGY